MKKYLLFLGLCFVAQTTFAHKLNLFAYVEGTDIQVEGYFSDGIKARNAKVTVTDPEGNLVNEGRADEEGKYRFSSAGNGTLLIKIDAGLGHVASHDLGSVSAAAQGTESRGGSVTSNVDIQRAVSEAIKPLALEISELRNKTRTSDIIGGVGFIVGLLGVFAYFKARKPSN